MLYFKYIQITMAFRRLNSMNKQPSRDSRQEEVLNMLLNDILPVPLVVESNRCAAAETIATNNVLTNILKDTTCMRRKDAQGYANQLKDAGAHFVELSSIICTGSRADGLTVPAYYDRNLKMPVAPDVDMLYCFSNLLLDVSTGRKVPVFESVSHEPNSSYGKLHTDTFIMSDGTVHRDYIGLFTSFRKYLQQNTLFPSSLKMGELLFGIPIYDSNTYEVHGPALTRVLKFEESVVTSMDQSCALHFSYWPNAADDFLTRHRATGWPTQCMLKDIEEGGFYMTPCIRYKNSRNMEWRYSFTNAETQLVESLSDIQRTTYIHVKLLRNIYFSSPDVLKSYFLKTILFWLCEKVPQSCWRLDNMASMIRLFLEQVLI